MISRLYIKYLSYSLGSYVENNKNVNNHEKGFYHEAIIHLWLVKAY
jgi:hypothetical protein